MNLRVSKVGYEIPVATRQNFEGGYTAIATIEHEVAIVASADTPQKARENLVEEVRKFFRNKLIIIC